MPRFYNTFNAQYGNSSSYKASVPTPSGKIEIEISEAVYKEIDSLQREFWRVERREARHTYHIEQMSDHHLPHSHLTKNPEQLMMERLEADELKRAFCKLTNTQRKRFLLRNLAGLSIGNIAQIEGCSERAVKYSLALARKNLKELLQE